MLAIHLARAGAAVSLFHTVHDSSVRDAATKLADFPEDVSPNLRSVMVDYPPRGRWPGHYIADSWRYSERLLAHYQDDGATADIVYAQGLTGLAFVRARRHGEQGMPPVFVNQHGYEMFQRAADWTTALQHRMLRGTFAGLARDADRVIAFPGRIRRIVEERCGVSAARIIELPNAIDDSWLVADRPPPSLRRRFLFVGRHERRKGVPELLDAIAALDPGLAEFHFVGAIPTSLRLSRADVTYHGPITDEHRLKRVLDESDVLVCPSFAEGMPTVVLEAMARGLAVIATDVGATAAWVDDANGFLLPGPRSSLVRDAIANLASMPGHELHARQRESLGRARAYTWPEVAAATLDALAAALPSRQQPPTLRIAAHGHR